MKTTHPMRLALASLLLVAALLAAPVAAQGTTRSAAAKKQQTRYSLVHGCYALTAATGRPLAGADHIRMQATALGRYLLYRPDRAFIAAQDDGSVSPADAPSPAADWTLERVGDGLFALSPQSQTGRVLSVGGDGAGSLADAASAGNAAQLRFVPATGCAVYPEAALSATGTPAKGNTSFGRVGGLVEGHMHWMTFEYLGGKFHCGRP